MIKKYEGDYLRKAYGYATDNLKELREDEGMCGCFSCCSIFYPHEIKNYIVDTEKTAICPYCYTDAIIGSYSRIPITREFLEAMNQHWFNGKKEIDWCMSIN